MKALAGTFNKEQPFLGTMNTSRRFVDSSSDNAAGIVEPEKMLAGAP